MCIARNFHVIIRTESGKFVSNGANLTGEQLTAKMTEAGVKWDVKADDEYFDKLAYLQVGNRAVLNIQGLVIYVDGAV